MQRLADRDHTITNLRDFKTHALAQLASQHDEINRLRSQNEQAAKIRLLPQPRVSYCTHNRRLNCGDSTDLIGT